MEEKIELTSILKELHNISGFRISIYDAERREIAAYPKEHSAFCAELHRNPRAWEVCVSYDRKAFDIVDRTGEIYFYHCKFGLCEAVAPLYQFGVPAGYLMMGQSSDDLSDSKRELVYRQALPYCLDVDSLKKATQQIPFRTKDQILSCMTIMNVCAQYITLSNRMGLNSRDLAHQIRNYINQNYSHPISIDQLCERFFCSRATLSNAFKRIYSTTVNRYIGQVRLEHAVMLLEGTTKPMKEIAQACGFSDQNYFAKAFQKAFGQPPSEYRRKIQSENWEQQ